MILEPVYIPVFEAIMPGYKLINVIDIATLVGEGTLFNINQVFTVTNGVLPETNAIVFKDASAYLIVYLCNILHLPLSISCPIIMEM